jgi:hypothetical protein
MKKAMNLAKLMKKVQSLKLQKPADIFLTSDLPGMLFDEWKRLRGLSLNQLNDAVFNEELHAEYAAEEELTIGLLCLLNLKIIDFVATYLVIHCPEKTGEQQVHH